VTPFCHTDTPPEKLWKVFTSSRAIVAGRVAAVKTDALVITQNLPHEIRLEPQFASSATQPGHGRRRPRGSDMSEKQGREQHQDKEAAHDFQRLHLHVLHVSTRLALEAVGMLESGTVSPLIIDELSVGGSGDRRRHTGVKPFSSDDTAGAALWEQRMLLLHRL
jgi:hypothetical protein